jgi:hypothetical protein
MDSDLVFKYNISISMGFEKFKTLYSGINPSAYFVQYNDNDLEFFLRTKLSI